MPEPKRKRSKEVRSDEPPDEAMLKVVRDGDIDALGAEMRDLQAEADGNMEPPPGDEG